jgi:hypothetical protein
MFSINIIIAWDPNIYHKHKDIIIITLLLTLGHISNICTPGDKLPCHGDMHAHPRQRHPCVDELPSPFFIEKYFLL